MKARYKIAVIPALIFWAVSLVFFVLGLSFGVIDLNTLTFATFLTNSIHNILFWIALGLSLSNTVIQIIGNDADPEEIGTVLLVGWIASYVLGIGSNINSLIQILQIASKWIEIPVAIALGTMVEIMPERLFVLFWRSTFPNGIMSSFGGLTNQVRSFSSQRGNRRGRGHSNQESQSHHPSRPKGMPREEWQKQLQRFAAAERGEDIEDGNEGEFDFHFVGQGE